MKLTLHAKNLVFLIIPLQLMISSCKKNNIVDEPVIKQPEVKITVLDSTLNDPRDIVTDKAGNIYISETLTSNITKMSPDGTKSTFAGIGKGDYKDDIGTAAAFNVPMEMAFDADGNLFVCDGNNVIRKITPGGIVTTVRTSEWIQPIGITADSKGNLYVADLYRVVKITQAGTVSLFAGGTWGSIDGTGGHASFENIRSMAFDPISGNVMLADGSGLVRKITSETVVTTIPNFKLTVPGENGSTVGFSQGIQGIVFDKTGNMFVADYYGRRIVKITPSGTVSDYVSGKNAKITFNALTIDELGNLYALDNSGNVRKCKLYKIPTH